MVKDTLMSVSPIEYNIALVELDFLDRFALFESLRLIDAGWVITGILPSAYEEA